MTHSSVWHDSFMSVAWLIHLCDLILQENESYHRHDKWVMSHVTWMSHVARDMNEVCRTRHEWVMSQQENKFVPWSNRLWVCCSSSSYVCDTTHSYVWHDSFICVTWLIHMCDMTHSYVWHDSFICVTW